MITYSKSDLGLRSILSSLIIKNPSRRLETFFREYSGKRYVLITNSCRTALYLTYKALGNCGEIITSPLTCKAAVDPILAAGYKAVYQDIDRDSLNVSLINIEGKINPNTRGIQIIHLGGVPCEMEKLYNIAHSNGLFIVEDCAQGLFAERDGIKAGTMGDIVCFSLAKNAKGIGGGVLATNDEKVYNKAFLIQKSFKRTPLSLVFFRIIRNILENYRGSFIIDKFYNLILHFRKFKKKDLKESRYNEFDLRLFKPSSIEKRVNVVQLLRAIRFRSLRQEKGLQFLRMLQEERLIDNYKEISEYKCSFVKFLIFKQELNSSEHIALLNRKGVEAMHLTHKFNTFYQARFDVLFPDQKEKIYKCRNYIELHDHIISLPFYERLSVKEMGKMVQILKAIIN